MTSAVTEEAGAKTFDETLLEIENRWAEATYETKGRERNDALEALLNDVRAFAERHPDRPEAAAWHGVIARECIKNRGRSRSTKLRREAREALLKAESLDPLVLDGLVYANLGALYSQTHSGIGGKSIPMASIPITCTQSYLSVRNALKKQDRYFKERPQFPRGPIIFMPIADGESRFSTCSRAWTGSLRSRRRLTGISLAENFEP
jgi:hypothetical protein